MHSSTIRSARSISPPLASSPSDSALARWYEITNANDDTAYGSTARRGSSWVGEVVGDAAEQERVGHAVDGRVEEGAALTRRARRLGERAVEQVGQRRQDHEDQPQRDVPGADRDRGRRPRSAARRSSGGRASCCVLRSAAPSGLHRGVDRRAELAVEHRQSPALPR